MEIKNYKGILFFDEKGNKDTLLAKGNDFQEVVLKTENYQYIQPISFNESVYQFAETEKAETIGVSLKIQLFYKEGITIRYEDSNNNVVAEYVITEKNVFSEKMKQIVTFLREGSENDFATEVSLITLALKDKIWNTKEIKTDFVKDSDDENPKPPLPKFKVGDRVTFNKVPFATFRVMEDPKYNSEKGKFVYRLANEDGKSSFSASYEDEMNLIVVETPMDCDADPTKIVSGQVKAFYDLNKNRIDKLNSKFSCKIIKALVSLSEYEKCGSPSSATVTKAKTDLLSKISKLKV